MTEQSGTAPVTESAVDVADTLESVAATEAPSAANPRPGGDRGREPRAEAAPRPSAAGEESTGENGATAARGGKGAPGGRPRA